MDAKTALANSEQNLNNIIRKAQEDETFKKKLVSNPVQAIGELLGQEIDMKGKKIVATDQSDPSTFYLNIPVNYDNMELTDAELEAVAGGIKIELGWTFICVDTSNNF